MRPAGGGSEGVAHHASRGGDRHPLLERSPLVVLGDRGDQDRRRGVEEAVAEDPVARVRASAFDPVRSVIRRSGSRPLVGEDRGQLVPGRRGAGQPRLGRPGAPRRRRVEHRPAPSSSPVAPTRAGRSGRRRPARAVATS